MFWSPMGWLEGWCLAKHSNSIHFPRGRSHHQYLPGRVWTGFNFFRQILAGVQRGPPPGEAAPDTSTGCLTGMFSFQLSSAGTSTTILPPYDVYLVWSVRYGRRGGGAVLAGAAGVRVRHPRSTTGFIQISLAAELMPSASSSSSSLLVSRLACRSAQIDLS